MEDQVEQHQKWWQQIKKHPYATGVAELLVLMLIIFSAYWFGWSATGFLDKSLWDWLQLPIVPLVLAVVMLVFQLANTRTERQIAQKRFEQDQKITLYKLREDLLQVDFDRIGALLFKDGTNVSTKPHLCRQATNKTPLQRQANDDKEAWKASWKEQGQSWRTEPEIDTEQQKYLAERREQGIYPFKGIKLSRADVEWPLATHENGRGPVDWNDESQREREGLDLRGANLHKENLSGLPLACLNGGLTGSIWNTSTLGLDERTAAFLEPVMRINKVIEEGIDLSEAELKGTDLRGANLESANLTRAHLEGAALGEAQMEGAVLYDAWLKKASLRHTHLESAILRGAQLSGADLNYAQLDGADLNHADLKGADLSLASFEKAHLTGARLKSATLMWTQLDGASLDYAQLEGAYLGEAHLGRVDLREAQLDGASLYEAVLNDKQGIGPCLVDVQWGNTNITVVDWTSVKMLEDEHYARQTKEVDNYREAVRAYRQLSVVLGDQGLNEDAARFAYRAQVLQRKVQLMELAQWRWIKNVEVWIQNIKNWKPFLAFWQIIHMPGLWEKVTKFGQWIRRVGIQMQKIGAFLFSFFLDLLAGYGYRPGRTLFWYLLAIVSFASAYVFYGHIPPFPDTLVFSLMSFHGRGFFPSLSGETNLHNPLVVLAALEAVIGLFIEISFIATFTKRFFGS